ncbi:hypothetical protein Tco_0128729 [Tanacetum coccineum]
MASEGIDSEAEYALSRQLQRALQRALLWSNPTTLGVAFSLARVVEARFANQGPTTTSATPNLKPPTSPILTIMIPKISILIPNSTRRLHTKLHHSTFKKPVRKTLNYKPADTVAKIEETSEFYTSESEEHRTKPKKGKSNDDGFKWGVQEASTFEELKHQLSTTPVLSLPDFNEVFLIEAECDRHGAV